jgi:hypothetical protein
MGDKVFNVLGSIVILAIVTTLVLPGRQTVGVVNAGGNAFAGGLRAAMGG